MEESNLNSDLDAKFIERLGSGVFGDVYKGIFVTRGPYFNTTCAIKKITNENSYRNETNFLKILKHQNIIEYLGGKEVRRYKLDLTYYIFMECCNETLKDRLMRKRNDFDHLAWMLEISSALAYLQSLGIVHRDLKPANILVKTGTDGDCIKISDFGLAKKMEDMVYSDGQIHPVALQTPIGPVMCAAPEIVKCHQYDTRCDVFSMGCISYGMLEHCFKVVDGYEHFSAFVFVPEKGERIPLGIALVENESLKIGITKNFNPLSNQLKELTLGMLEVDIHKRMYAAQVNSKLIKIYQECNQAVHQRTLTAAV